MEEFKVMTDKEQLDLLNENVLFILKHQKVFFSPS
jgi:hypothetical protein